jgi:hypothetical protein
MTNRNTIPERSAFDFEWPTASKFGASPKPTSAPSELTVQHWFTKNTVESHPNAVHCFTPRAALPRFQTIAEGDDSKKCFKRLHRHRYSPTACYGSLPDQPTKFAGPVAKELRSAWTICRRSEVHSATSQLGLVPAFLSLTIKSYMLFVS